MVRNPFPQHLPPFPPRGPFSPHPIPRDLRLGPPAFPPALPSPPTCPFLCRHLPRGSTPPFPDSPQISPHRAAFHESPPTCSLRSDSSTAPGRRSSRGRHRTPPRNLHDHAFANNTFRRGRCLPNPAATRPSANPRRASRHPRASRDRGPLPRGILHRGNLRIGTPPPDAAHVGSTTQAPRRAPATAPPP